MTQPAMAALQSLKRFPGEVRRWWRDQFPNLLLLIPLLVAVAVNLVSHADIAGWSSEDIAKDHLEIIHPTILALTLGIVVVGRFLKADLALTFFVLLAAAFLSRELLGQGNSWIVYVTVLGLIIYGDRRREDLGSLLRNRFASSALAMTFISYFISQLLDRGIIRGIIRAATGDGNWKFVYSSNMEESLESLGGVFLLIAALGIMRALFGSAPKSL